MNLSIEKKPSNNQETYFVFTNGDKKFEVEANVVKSILLLWVFFATVFLTLIIGQQSVYQNTMVTAYLTQGKLTNERGQLVVCNPIMTEEQSIEWDCIIQNITLLQNVSGATIG